MKDFLRSALFFPSVTRLKILCLLIITVMGTVFEGFGVAMLFPIMDFIEKGKNFDLLAATSRMWKFIVAAFDLFSIPKNLLALMVIVFLLMLVRQGFLFGKRVYSKWVTENILADIRTTGMERFLLSDVSFFDTHGVGQLINVMTVDGERAGGAIFTFFNLLASLLILFFYVAFLMLLDPGMTLFTLAILGCVGLILRSLFRKSRKTGEEISAYNEEISSSIVERLSGVRLLKLAATEVKETEHIRGLSKEIKDRYIRLSVFVAWMEGLVEPLVILAALIILYFSVEVFHLSLAETGIFVFVLLRLLPYTKEAFTSKQALAAFEGSLHRVRDLLVQAGKSRTIEGGSRREFVLKEQIAFEDVSFSYGERDFRLDKVNLRIPAGKMTALVGRSGAGKSTLVDLIPRLRVPHEGRISVDGVSLEDFDLGVLRRSIAFVSQEGFLFNDTIRNNIRYACPAASEEDIVTAAEMAYAHEFILGFPDGYGTMVGERGVRLSGGQKQRIILARALLQRASIIILDEPTSSLDSESEQNIQKAMEGIRRTQSTTMIVIAHRLSTIRRADQIIVVDSGKIVESGSHGELMHEETWYADMVRAQAVSLAGS